MQWIDSVLDWAKANDGLLWWLFAASMALVLLTAVAVVWVLIRLPPGYFTEQHRKPLESWSDYPALRVVLLVAKNLLGGVLAVAGLLMLLAPGQGLLTLAAGLMLLDFPGKFRLERAIVKRKPVWRAINWLRDRAGCEPLKRPR